MTGKGTRVWKICIWNLWKTNKVEKVQMTASNTKTQSFHSRNLCRLTWAKHPWTSLSGAWEPLSGLSRGIL